MVVAQSFARGSGMSSFMSAPTYCTRAETGTAADQRSERALHSDFWLPT